MAVEKELRTAGEEKRREGGKTRVGRKRRRRKRIVSEKVEGRGWRWKKRRKR